MTSCGHDGWQAGCAECEREHELATAYIEAAERGGRRSPPQTRWLLRRAGRLAGLRVEVVADTDAPEVVEAIEEAARNNGIVLNRLTTLDELEERGEPVPRRFRLRPLEDEQ